MVSGIIKRNAGTFKTQIIEGSQCNAAYKKFPLNQSKPKHDLVDCRQDSGQFLTKVLLFEDVDTVFLDEGDFYN